MGIFSFTIGWILNPFTAKDQLYRPVNLTFLVLNPKEGT